MNNKIKFFLGANSNRGFVSYFKQLQCLNNDLRLLILKGGPGSGKSSLIKRIAEFAEGLGHKTEYIPCASDPDSLDAFIDNTAKFAMMDGTAPHIEDPVLPGAMHHIMYTGDCWDAEILQKNRYDIKFLSEKISDCHSGAGAYIKAAAALLEENYRHGSRYVKTDKIFDIAKEITDGLSFAKNPIVSDRLLSAVTVGKTEFFGDTLSLTADKIYSITDPWGEACDILMKYICDTARGKGIDIIRCPSSIIPEKIEHIIFPNEKIAITRSDSFHNSDSAADTIIDGLYISLSNTAEFDKRISDAHKLLDSAGKCIARAKKLHDELESYYISAMDYSKLDDMYKKIIDMFYIEH